MSNVVENFYVENKAPQVLIRQKMKDFDQNPDIASEFELWITTGKYRGNDAVTVEGYTAERLSEISPFLNGEGAFMMLMELRKNTSKALKQIKKGFKIK